MIQLIIRKNFFYKIITALSPNDVTVDKALISAFVELGPAT